jgi:hypothetical protein
MEHTMNQPSTITLERPTPQIASITFSNPPANLIVGETVTRLHETIVELGEDPDIQVVVFKSGVPDFYFNHFDLAAMADFPAPEAEDAIPIWTDIVLRPPAFAGGWREREVGVGRHRFDELLESLGIASNVLTDHLNRLLGAGVLGRVRYIARPVQGPGRV